MAEVVRFGVIGAGGMGSGHCGMLGTIPEAELTAVADIDAGVRTAISAKYSVPAFENATELLESGLVDAVIIATPHYDHPPIAVQAFSQGLHVMSEKPLGVTVSGADSMISAAKEAAKEYGSKFGVMYQMRAEGPNLAAKSVIESGVLGDIRRTNLVMGWYRSQAYYNSGGWRATWAGEGGGVLINQSPHALDLFTWLGGLPVKITGTTRTVLHDIEVEDEAFAVLEYANGAHGYLYTTTNQSPQQQGLEICGDKGKLTLDYSGLKVVLNETSVSEFTRNNTEMWASPKTQPYPVEIPQEGEIKSHAAITQNFARAILFGEPLIAPGEEGLNAVELINGIILSSKTGESVSTPVDRAAYNALIEELKASSKRKTNVVENRVTDPKFA